MDRYFFILCGLSLLTGRILITRFILPISIIMISLSIVISSISLAIFGEASPWDGMVHLIHFEPLLFNGFLPFLLYAGAICLSKKSLQQQMKEISILSFLSTLGSIALLTVIVRYGSLYCMSEQWGWIECALLGTILSPTDPVAVLGLIKYYKINSNISALIAGESLFNDGIGIVVYGVLVDCFLNKHVDLTIFDIIFEFIKEVAGGVAFGYFLFYIGSVIRKAEKAKSEQLEHHLLLDIALVFSGYHICLLLGFSGALAMVVLGVESSSYLDADLSNTIKKYYIEVWESIDLILNIIIYTLIGILGVMYKLDKNNFSLFIVILFNLFWVRLLTIYLPLKAFSLWDEQKHLRALLVWGGLKGALALALALTLPPMAHKANILVITYAVVFFSVVVQGFTISPIIKKLSDNQPQDA